MAEHSSPNRLFLTSGLNLPQIAHHGDNTVIPEMQTSHEEADIIIVQQCFNALSKVCSSITIISDDADDFVLLVHYYDQTNCMKLVLMEETHGARNVIDIGQTVSKYSHLAATLPALHALTGCDSTSKIHEIGKKTALNISKKATLINMGFINSQIEDIVQEATQFISLCYGIAGGAEMTSKRYIKTICIIIL